MRIPYAFLAFTLAQGVSVAADAQQNQEWRKALAADLPRYDPTVRMTPAPDFPGTAPPGVIRMPTLTVRGFMGPRFTERQLYTKSALEAVAVKRYLSAFDSKVLNVFTIPGGISKETRAMEDYADAERGDSLRELSNLAALIKADGQPDEAKRLTKLYQETYARQPDWHEWLPSYRHSWVSKFEGR